MGEVLDFRRGGVLGREAEGDEWRVGLGVEEMGILRSDFIVKHCTSWVPSDFSTRSWRRANCLVLKIPNARMH